MLGAVGLAVLAAIALIASRILRKRPKPADPTPELTPPPSKPTPLSGAHLEKSAGAVESLPAVSLLTTEQPQPGAPYFESQGLPLTVLYCPLTERGINIGRGADNDLVIDGRFAGWQTVSRYHARVEYDGKQAVLLDSGARNGVLVNGRRTGINALGDGSVVSFGQVQFVFWMNSKGGAK